MKQTIANLLIAYGDKLCKEARYSIIFTEDPKANEFVLSDSNAFLFGVILNQWTKSERAWAAPFFLSQRLNGLDPKMVSQLETAYLSEIISAPPSLHRIPTRVAEFLIQTSKTLVDKYSGDASNIWNDRPSSKELAKRLTEMHGIGQKKASMAMNILIKQLKLLITNPENIDVAYDIHIRRVFFRTGLVKEDLPSAIIESARQLSPSFPAALDFPAWSIGRDWCFPSSPDCENCPLTLVCSKRIKVDLEQALLRMRQLERAYWQLFNAVKSEFEKLKRKIEQLSRSEMIVGTLHEYCAYHGECCKQKGQRNHPVRYLLRTKEGTQHVPQNKLSIIQRRIQNREEQEKAFELLENYSLLLSEWEDSLTEAKISY